MTSYDEQGNAILNLGSNAETATASLKLAGNAPYEPEQSVPGEFVVSHDTAAVEEHNRHQKDGENDHTESRAEQGNTYPGNGQWIVEGMRVRQSTRSSYFTGFSR